MDFLFDVGVGVGGSVVVNKRGHKLERTPKLMEPLRRQFSFQQIEFWNFSKEHLTGAGLENCRGGDGGGRGAKGGWRR